MPQMDISKHWNLNNSCNAYFNSETFVQNKDYKIYNTSRSTHYTFQQAEANVSDSPSPTRLFGKRPILFWFLLMKTFLTQTTKIFSICANFRTIGL